MDKLEPKTRSKIRDLVVKLHFIEGIWWQCFFTDVVFTLLPIVIIIIIDYLTIGKIDILYLSPIWSFATIVYLGLSITKFIEMKAKYQRDLSAKIYYGTRFYIILMIFTVIVLCLLLLRDKGLNINTKLLWRMQMFFFTLSVTNVFIGSFFKELYLENYKIKKKLPISLNNKEYYNFLSDSLNKTYEELMYLRFAIKRKPYAKFSGALSDEKRIEIKLLFEKTDSAFLSVKSNFNQFINSPSSIPDQNLTINESPGVVNEAEKGKMV